VFFRYMVIGMYVGFATVGVFVFWFVFYVDFINYLGDDMMAKLGSTYDGHSMVTYEQLTHWGHCTGDSELFKDFKVNDFDANGDGIVDDFSKKPCNYFTDGKVKASTMSLSVLVTIEMFNALNAISEDGSLLMVPPWVNPYLLLAMAASFAMHFVILYVPFLSSIFEIAPHTAVEWVIVVAFSFPVIVIGTRTQPTPQYTCLLPLPTLVASAALVPNLLMGTDSTPLLLSLRGARSCFLCLSWSWVLQTRSSRVLDAA
jgi:Ca2+-transporting ATPase